jgi:hypothetical protein
MPNQTSIEKTIGKGTVLKANAFAKDHFHLMGTLGSWDRKDITQLAGLIFDQSQHFQEGYAHAVLAALAQTVSRFHTRKMSAYKPRLETLNTLVLDALTARALMMSTPTKAETQLTQHEDPDWAIKSQESSELTQNSETPAENILNFAMYASLISAEQEAVV